MKKTVLVILSMILSTGAFSQKIKLFESYLRLNDLSTRYVAVLEDNSIWWFAPGQPWEKSSVEGLPDQYTIKHISCYSKEDGKSRYVVVLEDNSIWWLAPGQPWKRSSTEGLPE